MKRLLLGLALLLIGLAVLAVSGFWFVLGRSLPTLDGHIPVDGLTANVLIERDDLGIPTLIAANRIDLAYGTGFVHGQDRFFQMDISRRNAAGELSELFGAVALPLDRAHRFHRFRARAQVVLAMLPASATAVLDAYARGVNDGLNDNGAKPFEYFLIGDVPEPWRPADTLLVVYSMYLELNDELADRDIRRGLAQQALPGAVFAWLYPDGTAWDAPLLGVARPAAAIPGPETYSLVGVPALETRPKAVRGGEADLPGSNSWAVSGRLTVSGGAIVANDLHLGLSVPNIVYRARARTSGAGGINLSGVTLPGTPVWLAGSNGHIAWSNTNSYGNWSDAVLLLPGDRDNTYVTADGIREYSVYRETIRVKDAPPAELVIRETIWGPVRENSPDPDRRMAISWVAHHPEAVSLGHLDLEGARSVDAAIVIANTIGMPPQNFVVGDSDGNIGWTIAGRIPAQAGTDRGVPADWSTSGAWAGWLAAAEYPRIVNPDSGRIWTANARVVDAAMLAIIGDGGYALGARAKQIRDRLFARDSFEPLDMLAVQLDDEALFLARWRELLLRMLDEDATLNHPARVTFREVVAAGMPRAAIDSVAYRLVRDFRLEVRDRVFSMLMTPVIDRYGAQRGLRMSNQFEGPLWSLLAEQPAHLLAKRYSSWQDLLLQAVDANIEIYAETYDEDLRKRSWGERNTMAIRHPLSNSMPAFSRWLDMPAEPLPGDADMPRVIGPSFGASVRFAVTPGDENVGYLHMPTGQSGHPLSPFYRAGHADWAAGVPTPFLPGPPRHSLRLEATN